LEAGADGREDTIKVARQLPSLLEASYRAQEVVQSDRGKRKKRRTSLSMGASRGGGRETHAAERKKKKKNWGVFDEVDE